MTPEQKWHQISNFSFPQSFYELLCEREDWLMEFSLQAVDEYKKFMYIATYSSVTPSKAIDQVWHLHIQHTDLYQEFCQGIFDRDFCHHNPELIQPQNGFSTYHNQYYDTLERYYWEFASHPPRNIWFYKLKTGFKVKSNGDNTPLSTVVNGQSWWRNISRLLPPALFTVIIPANRKKNIPAKKFVDRTGDQTAQDIQESILQWQFPEGFASRLMREEDWTEDEAKKAIDEYLQFQGAKTANSNSSTINDLSTGAKTVWMLHLLATSDYQRFSALAGVQLIPCNPLKLNNNS